MIFENVTLCKSICEPGFMGDNCDFVCPNGYFGEMCDSKCNCQKESRCDSATGKCFDDLVDGLKYQKELENSIANHKNYKVVSPYMNIDFNKSDYAESFKLYKEMDQNQTMKVKLLEVLGYFDIEPMKENQYQTYLEKNKELKQKFDQVMDSNIHENSSNAMNKFEEKANQTEFDEMLSSIKSQATESHNIDFHEEDKAFLRFAGYVLIFMLVILALVFLYLKMLKLEERRNGSDAVSQSIFNMYEKPAKNFGKPLPCKYQNNFLKRIQIVLIFLILALPKLTLPQLVRQKSVFFEDIITEQRPLECRLEKLRTIPENYDVPHNNASITDLYSSSSKETKFPNAQTAPVHHTFPRRKSTISLNMEHIYDEINEKGGSRM